jgi:hypothetical protein
MTEKRTVFLTTPRARQTAHAYLDEAPDGHVMELREANRTLDQNAKFHAICSEIAKSGFKWFGNERDAAAWKVLLVSGHAVATKEGAEMVPGLEGEYVNIRESTARMSKKRSASLITYTLAFCDMNGISLYEKYAEEPA